MTEIDVGEVIDRERPGRFHWVSFVLCSALLFFDGFDAQAAGYVAPALVHAWHLNKVALGPLFSIGSLGFICGATGFGLSADRFGRRPALLACVLVFGVFSILSAVATNLAGLCAFRFLAGLGIGGAMPNSFALISEYFPARLRSRIIMLSGTGYALGSALSGMVGALVVPRYGWRALFVVGGATPLLLLLVWVPLLPESLRFMVLKGAAPARVSAMLRRMYPRLPLPADVTYAVVEKRRDGVAVTQLFRDGRGLATILLWIGIFCNLAALGFLLNWLPTLATDAGMAIAAALAATATFSLGGMFGTITLGWVLDRFGAQASLAALLLLVAIPIASLGAVAGSFAPMAATVFVIGFLIVGSNMGGMAVSGLLYPTPIRSTGLGWALGAGRSASFFAPLLGSAFVHLDLSIATMFRVIAAFEVVAATSYTIMYLVRPVPANGELGKDA